MTALYAVAVVAGFVAVLAWVAAVAMAETVPGWHHVDPDARFGRRGRIAVGAVAGFGIAGMSATFAGWPVPVALAAAAAGAATIGVAARFLAGERNSGTD